MPVREVNSCADTLIRKFDAQSFLLCPETDASILFNFRNKQCQPSINWFAKAALRKQ
jgi:hypothetical protein